MPSDATRWRSCGYAREHVHRAADALQVAAQMAEPRSSVKCDNVFPADDGWG